MATEVSHRRSEPQPAVRQLKTDSCRPVRDGLHPLATQFSHLQELVVLGAAVPVIAAAVRWVRCQG
jgi:hypothetical protein